MSVSIANPDITFVLGATDHGHPPAPSGSTVASYRVPAPQTALLGAIAPRWRLVQPLLLTFTRDAEGHCIFSDDQFLLYGDGDTPEAAYADYVQTLIHYYQSVEDGAQGNAYDVALLRRLQLYLCRTA